ncbi:MAG: GntR family transcriptional regulator [Dethiobacter sp.]|jgi:GntR family transcriptional regulator|nr:GntR family transcriptional regulator [Dethiobacter sp.]
MIILDTELERESETPLYEQLADLLEKAILSGELQVGQKILSEDEFVKKFHISRSTVRLALDILVNKCLLVRRSGKGTFVNFKLHQGLKELKSLFEVLVNQGINCTIEELSIKAIKPSKELSQKLLLKNNNNKVLSIERKFLVDKSPIAYSHIFIPFERIGSTNASYFEKQSSYLVLENIYRVKIQRAKQLISAVNASSYIANQLSITKGDPVLFVTRVAYDQDNQPIEYLEQYYRSDRFSFEIEMPRNKITYLYNQEE